jgi:hypothetical protein
LAHAAGELMRVVLDARAGRRDIESGARPLDWSTLDALGAVKGRTA